MTPAVSFRFFSRSPEASQHPSQLLKCSLVTMTKYFQQRQQLLNSLFGSRASDAKISHFQGAVAGTWEKFSVWNMKLCLHLSFPIDGVSKAKPVVRAGFLISLQCEAGATRWVGNQTYFCWVWDCFTFHEFFLKPKCAFLSWFCFMPHISRHVLRHRQVDTLWTPVNFMGLVILPYFFPWFKQERENVLICK